MRKHAYRFTESGVNSVYAFETHTFKQAYHMRTKTVNVYSAYETHLKRNSSGGAIAPPDEFRIICGKNAYAIYAFCTHLKRIWSAYAIWYACLNVCVSNAYDLLREGLTSVKCAFY